MSNHDYHVISWGSSWVMPWLQPLPYSLAVPLTSVAPLNWWHHLHLQRMELDEDVGWRVGWIWPSSSTTNHPKTKENNSLRSFVVHALLCLCLEQVLFSSFQFDMAQSWEAIMVQPLPPCLLHPSRVGQPPPPRPLPGVSVGPTYQSVTCICTILTI